MSTLQTQQANLIAFSNYNHGSIPEESLVIITLRGTTSEGQLRVNIPEGNPVETAIRLLGMLEPSAPDGIVPILYTERDKNDHFDLIAAVLALALGKNLRVPGALLVRKDSWQEFFEDETHPIAEVEHAPIAAEMIAHGHALKESEEHDIPNVSDDRDFQQRIESFLHKLPPIPDVWDMQDSTYRMARDEWDRALVNDFGPPDAAASRLIAYFQRKPLRDRLLADIVTLSDDKETWAKALIGEGVRVQRSRIRRAVSLLTNLAGRSTAEYQPQLLTALGWCHWMMGEGTIAMGFVERALEVDPRINMAALLQEAISQGVLPECAITPPAS